jgi:hypothetical protein
MGLYDPIFIPPHSKQAQVNAYSMLNQDTAFIFIKYLVFSAEMKGNGTIIVVRGHISEQAIRKIVQMSRFDHILVLFPFDGKNIIRRYVFNQVNI